MCSAATEQKVFQRVRALPSFSCLSNSYEIYRRLSSLARALSTSCCCDQFNSALAARICRGVERTHDSSEVHGTNRLMPYADNSIGELLLDGSRRTSRRHVRLVLRGSGDARTLKPDALKF